MSKLIDQLRGRLAEAKRGSMTLNGVYREAEVKLLRSAASLIKQHAGGYAQNVRVLSRTSAGLHYVGQDSSDIDLEFSVTLIPGNWPQAKIATWGKSAMTGKFTRDVKLAMGLITPEKILDLFKDRFGR